MYLLGKGVVPNMLMSHMWLNIAAANGSTEAIKTRDELAKVGMSGQQIELAQQMAKQCQLQNYKNCGKLN
jgi:hypothetical protein